MHTKHTTWQTTNMEVDRMGNSPKSNLSGQFSDKQAVKKNLSRELDHELANEPLSMAEKMNNKKTKKRQ